jgi:hypothetical protein
MKQTTSKLILGLFYKLEEYVNDDCHPPYNQTSYVMVIEGPTTNGMYRLFDIERDELFWHNGKEEGCRFTSLIGATEH